MSGKPEVGIGIVGYGLMGRAHAYGYTLAPRIRDLPCTPQLRLISGRDDAGVAAAAGRYGVERWTTDWREGWLSDEFLDPDIPFDWRFERALGASTIADLGSHLVDLALWMIGDIDQVAAQSETFTPARSGRDVDVDEASSALVHFSAGARGVFEMAR